MDTSNATYLAVFVAYVYAEYCTAIPLTHTNVWSCHPAALK